MFLFLFAPLAVSQTAGSVSKPLDPKDFAVMAWGASPSDPAQLAGMKEAGLNVSGFCEVGDLNKVKAAGLTCFVNDKRINGYNVTNLPSDEEIRKNLGELSKQVSDNPAALGVFLHDEPNAAAMPGLGRLAALVRRSDAG